MKADKWVIYSTFDAEGLRDEPAVEQLVAYGAAGFKTLVIDTSPVLSDIRRQDWEATTTRWRHRENAGYDFGSYKFGLDHLLREEQVHAEHLDLVFTNDSCFGPFRPLSEVFEVFDGRPDEPNVVYGLTDSVQCGHHIQSYWLYFRAAACRHAVSFFDAMAPAEGREQAIEFGELALGAHLRSANCERIVWCPWDETLAKLALPRGRLVSTVDFLVRRVLRRWKYNRDADTQCLRWLLHRPGKMNVFNPIVLFGVQIYELGLSPLIKKSMFRENVYKSPEIPPGLATRGLSNAAVRQMLGPVRGPSR